MPPDSIPPKYCGMNDRLIILDRLVGAYPFPKHHNRIIYSKLHAAAQTIDDAGLSIKYVMEGVEHYTLDHQTHSLQRGQYLLVNRGRAYEVSFRASKPVEGLCVYLDPALVADVYHTMTADERALLDAPGRIEQDDIPRFYEHVVTDHEHGLGHLLRQVGQQAQQGALDDETLTPELYYAFAEQLLVSQVDLRRQMGRLTCARWTTREELFRRLRMARAFIEGNFDRRIGIPQIARAAALSEYHLIRTFKRVYNVTPHRYLMQQRLGHAAHRLRRGHETVSAVATDVGFADIHAFSKAFKKHYGMPPSHYARAGVA